MTGHRVRRRFVYVDGRRVHYLRAGNGPPAVLIHSSPANAWLLMKEIVHLAAAHTVFAFDTPGFGLSDPLPGDTLTVADLADALADTLGELSMPRCPVFGTHTGAAIALEFGVRHPQRVTGLVLDGVPAFTDDECDRYFGSYFQAMPPSVLGGHYAEAWTRFRDQSTWFPWTNRTPEHFNPYDLSPPHSTHLWVSMFFEAAQHYAPAYRAASFYGELAIAAMAALQVPAALCATETDMLYPHMARFGPLKSGQEIVPIGTSNARKRALIAERFALYGADGPPPADRDAIGSGVRVARQFVDGTMGQLHLRYAGSRNDPPLLLLHDALGSSEQLEPLIANLTAQFFVIAPDLPGCGESDMLSSAATLATFTEELVVLLDRLGIPTVHVYGIGFGGTVGVALAADHLARVSTLAIAGLPLPDEAERADLAVHYAPAIPVERDGAHWYRTWLMLRDSEIYFPWYRTTLAARRAVPGNFDARALHRRTMDVMRSRESYDDLVHAVLDYDSAAALRQLTSAPIQLLDPSVPTAAHDDRLAAVVRPAAVLKVSEGGLADGLAMRLAHGRETYRAFS